MRQKSNKSIQFNSEVKSRYRRDIDRSRSRFKTNVDYYRPKDTYRKVRRSEAEDGMIQQQFLMQTIFGLFEADQMTSDTISLFVNVNIHKLSFSHCSKLLFLSAKKGISIPVDVISKISDRISSFDESASAMDLSHAVYGMKLMTSDIIEVRDLASALAYQISNTRASFNSQDISNAL